MFYMPFAERLSRTKLLTASSIGTKRVLIVFYAADYRNIYNRIEAGFGEHYHAHRYSLEVISSVGQGHGEAIVLCCRSSESYFERVDNRLSFVGVGPDRHTTGQLLQSIQRLQPTHLILKVPNLAILKWAIQTRTRTAAIFADSFPNRTLKHKLKNRVLTHRLNHPVVEWVGNHGAMSCQALAHLGVKSTKIIPWDWPHTWKGYAAKQLDFQKSEFSAMFVGSVQEAKGVGDLIQAIARLNSRGINFKLTIAGDGDLKLFERMAQSFDLAERVEFLGLVEHSSIVARMRHSDFVVVPSRHEYPEGFPLTIYEALSSRSPLIASDHPMFSRILRHRVNSMVFPASNPAALADCIQEVLSQPELYSRLSEASHQTWQTLQLPVQWGDFIEKWLDDSAASRDWLSRYTLAKTTYCNRPPDPPP